MKRMQLILLTLATSATLVATQDAQAQSAPAAAPATKPALTQALPRVYAYWRNAMVNKNYGAWKKITAPHRRVHIQNRILSERRPFPAFVFNIPTAPPALKGLKLISSTSRGVTAKQVYFGKINFGVGGAPTENLLVLSFVYAERGWKYDSAEFINLSGLKDVRKQIQSGDYKYVKGSAFQPTGVLPRTPIAVGKAKYIAKVYTFCPGREVKADVNRFSSHRLQNTQQSEVIIGGAKDGPNTINYTIKDLPDYKGDDPITIRVYLFSEVKGVKPVEVFRYQTKKGEKPKPSGRAVFHVTPEIAARLRGK
ncbi:MAG: hypothetical protein ACPG6P_12540 [Akkermansiaceae bacterium]